MSLRLATEAYTVAWFAPLHFEASAAILMLDEHHQSPLPNEGQRLCYRFGRMGRTNVAIAFFPAGEIGIGVAGYMASEIQRDLRNIKTGILVGIGAGIPRYGRDMRLGDVVVASPTDNNSGVLGFDMVKIEPEQIVLKQWQNAPDRHIRSAMTNLRASPETTARFMSNLNRFRSTSFPQCPVPPPNVTCGSFTQRREPLIHYGCILSGNSVIKSAEIRNQLAREYDALAIEMEAAGMMNTLPVAVVRGISDWADAEKNDVWQEYAAATAAAVAKDLLACLDGSHSISCETQLRDHPAATVLARETVSGLPFLPLVEPPSRLEALLNASPTSLRNFLRISLKFGQSTNTWVTVSCAPHAHLSSSRKPKVLA
ncbi:hypothetical protein KXX21_009246 [Aspergillus fumigatus]|nr:hypothetical protein KXX29_007918 [Aspergillus fumigatus]KMK54475.1 Pfs domain-containing protein [Aspergillus fumigatus Z5]KAH1578069.1 hypothetical protein KXX17_006949 [Aspergillus fumigatus]KAH1617772.1 hypothetical protein KXX21_009246 [Aspergillus fumigatus]KAH1912041.1 hypothetical protein KXW69_008810 [Aspergillus fumigatus]